MRFLYNLTIIIIIIISPVIIIFRIFNGKENLKSFQEKFSFSTKKRNKGKLLWFHCSSVGEFLSIVPLIEMLEKWGLIDQITYKKLFWMGWRGKVKKSAKIINFKLSK